MFKILQLLSHLSSEGLQVAASLLLISHPSDDVGYLMNGTKTLV